MNIRIYSLEKHKNTAIKSLETEFLKRISPYCKVEMVSLKRPKINESDSDQKILNTEAHLILEKFDPKDYLVVLDSSGKQLDSIAFSNKIKSILNSGASGLAFIIGGPIGVSHLLLEKADYVMSLSKHTWTHDMARMLLVETLYRSFDLIHGGNYHK